MGSVVKFLKETYRKQTLWEAVKSGGWKAALDGTVAETTLIHGPTGTLVGEDELGNRYYENNDNQVGRHRWVVYKDLSWPLGQEATAIAPDWHGWIHCMYDVPPSHKDFKRPIYTLKHKPNKSGGGERYLPKGSWFNPKKRNWTKTQFWQPPKADGIVPPNA